MFNLLWGILFVLLHFGLFLLCYRLFGQKGLYAWVGIATVLANIQVTKTIEMMGIVMTLGNAMYITLYMTSDLLNEKHGPAEAKKAVWFGFFTLLMTTVIMQMSIHFISDTGEVAMASQASLETIFGFMPRLALGSLAAYFISQFLDVRIFSWIKARFNKEHQLWIRTNGSTMLSSLVDTLIFCTIAFAGIYSWEIWFEILVTTYLIKVLLTAVSTPVLYIARGFKVNDA